MSNVFLTDLTEITSPNSTDIVYIVHDPSGTPVDRKCTIGNILALNPSGILPVTNLGSLTSGFTASADYISLFSASGTWAITLPTGLSDTVIHKIILDFSTASGSQPTLSSSGNLKWKNNAAAPTYSTTSGLRNVITATTVDGGDNWILEHQSYGGIETTFTQPTLSANGSIGGASFAVSPSAIYDSSHDAWMAFNNNTSDSWNTPSGQLGNIIIYNPVALKVSKVTKRNETAGWGVHTAGSLYGSNDNVTYTKIMDYTNANTSGGASWDINISSANQAYYKYYKDVITSASSLTYGAICSEYDLTGTYIAII